MSKKDTEAKPTTKKKAAKKDSPSRNFVTLEKEAVDLLRDQLQLEKELVDLLREEKKREVQELRNMLRATVHFCLTSRPHIPQSETNRRRWKEQVQPAIDALGL